MKKLFISCPMKNRSDENIHKSMEQMHQIAEAVFGEKLEAIHSFIEENPPEGVNTPIWYLGESIKKMASADYFIGVSDCWGYPGCITEKCAADHYDIPYFLVGLEYVAPDVENDVPNEYINKDTER